MVKLNKFLSPSEGKTLCGRFSFHWTKSFGGNKNTTPETRMFGSLEQLSCSNLVQKCKMNCFNFKIRRACKTFLDIRGQKKRNPQILIC